MHKKVLPIVLFGLIPFLGCTNPLEPQHGDYHIHADFKVVLDEKVMDFNKARHMSTPYKELSERTHLHDFNPYVIHIHSKDITLGEFFATLGMDLNEDCFFDGAQNYCNGSWKTLQSYVNGKQNNQFGSYKPSDLDKILVYYGAGKPSEELLGSLTNWACVYSEKCAAPEGFVMPPESCTASKPCTIYDLPAAGGDN